MYDAASENKILARSDARQDMWNLNVSSPVKALADALRGSEEEGDAAVNQYFSFAHSSWSVSSERKVRAVLLSCFSLVVDVSDQLRVSVACGDVFVQRPCHRNGDSSKGGQEARGAGEP